MGKRWNDDENKILIDNKDLPIKQIMQLLPNRNEDSISMQRRKLNIHRIYDNTPNVSCIVCNKKFYMQDCRIKEYTYYCCSKECRKIWQKQFYKQDGYNVNTRNKKPRELWNKNEIRNKPVWTDEKIEELKQYMIQGKSYTEIGIIFNKTKDTISSVANKNNLNQYYNYNNARKSSGHLLLRNCLDEIFYDTEKINEYRAKPTRLFIDIFDDTLNIAYEYNGKQHYIKNNTWNRENEAFIKQLDRDKRKLQWCKENNIPLVIIKFDEEISKNLIFTKLKNVLDEHSFLFIKEKYFKEVK